VNAAALIAGGLPAEGLPTRGERPATAAQASGLAREQGALVVAWLRWEAAVVTPTAPPLGLVAGGQGLLLPPDELVVAPAQAASVAAALAALLARPSMELVAQAEQALAPVASPEAELWRVVLAGWRAALARDWGMLEAALALASALAERQPLPQVVRARALLLLGLLLLEAGEPADEAASCCAMAMDLFAGYGQDAPAGLTRWALALALERQGRSSEALVEAESALAGIDRAASPALYATVLAGVAGLRHHSPRAMLAALNEAARTCPEATNPLLAARLWASLGDARLSAAEVQEALACYERAVDLFAPHGTAEDLAAVQLSQGGAYQALSGRAGIQRAIDCYHKALHVYSLIEHPAEYALIHNNVATAYLSMLPSGEPEREMLRQAQAIQSLHEALKVYTLEEYPHEYAMVQNNLGNIFQYLPTRDSVGKLDQAIGAYKAALLVRSRQHTPVEYATTVSNLANAYANLPAADREETLALARCCYSEALEIFQAHNLLDQAQAVAQALAAITP